MKKSRERTRTIIRLALVAALYAVLTLLFQPISFGVLQFRISEVLVLLAFYRRDYAIGLIIGCLIANLFSPMLVYDVTFGVLATAIAVIALSRFKNIFVASLCPVVANAFLVALELKLAFADPFWLSVASVAIGEFVVVTVAGGLLFTFLARNPRFLTLIAANQNIPDDLYESIPRKRHR